MTLRAVSATSTWTPGRARTSPPTRHRPFVAYVSTATRACASRARYASRTASEIWTHSLSGWPPVTDSDVKRNGMRGPRDGRASYGRPGQAPSRKRPRGPAARRGTHLAKQAVEAVRAARTTRDEGPTAAEVPAGGQGHVHDAR